MTTKSSISNHHKVELYFKVRILAIKTTTIKAMKKETMKITVILSVMKMEVLTKITEIIMIKLAMKMALLFLLVVLLHQNKLILKLKNLKRHGIQKYLENLVIPILQLVLDTIWLSKDQLKEKMVEKCFNSQ
jgi:hypothetical protein